MFKLFRNISFSKRSIGHGIGLFLMILGAAIAIINIPVWFWMSVIGIAMLMFGLLLYNQK